MKIKLDENLPARLLPVLEKHGHDVDTVPSSLSDLRLIYCAGGKSGSFLPDFSLHRLTMRLEIVQNCPRSPTRLATIAQVRQAASENLTGRPDAEVWQAVRAEGRFLITQDLDFSDTRRFAPGAHAGLLLVRLREPGAQSLLDAIGAVVADMAGWAGCFVVLTDHKVRIKRP